MNSFLAWLAGLFGSPAKQPAATPLPSVQEVQRGDPAWLQLARGELGTKEAPGDANNPKVLAYYRDAGHPEINADSIAWCAAFTGAMLERAGYPSSKNLMARSYLTWGKALTKPYVGCVVVFSRGDPRSSEGHVGFYLGEDEHGIQVLGGNQGDAVSITHEPKSRLLGYREPVTGTNSRTARSAALGIVTAGLGGTVVLDSQTQLLGISAILKEMGISLPSFQLIAYLMQIAILAAIIWARWDDLKTKGR